MIIKQSGGPGTQNNTLGLINQQPYGNYHLVSQTSVDFQTYYP